MKRITVVVWVVAIGAAVAVSMRRRRDSTDPIARAGDVVPGAAEDREALLDTAAEDSFPASDPPSYWGRETEG